MNVLLTLENFKVFAKQEDPPPWRPWIVTGVQKLVVVCVEFSDVLHSTDALTIESRLGNMAEYFDNISFGNIALDITFYGDRWERLNNTMEYYGQDADGRHDAHGWNFIVDSITAWNKLVNFSDYDCVLVIHAGEDQSSYPERTELLWRQNYCNLGRTSKRTVRVYSEEYRFWGMAYDSEFEEWGLMAHEFGHSIGLPDLYIENKSLAFDSLSLMARGDRNGIPEGTCPGPLDGFCMYLLGWLNPMIVTLNSTEGIVKMKPLGNSSATLLRIPISESEYYLIEVREKSGNDQYTVSSTSVIVYIIDEIEESANGIATALTGGVVAEGSIYLDPARGTFVSFISFNSSTHLATVGLSTQLYFIDVDIPDSLECFFPATGEVQVFDTSNNSAQGIRLNISIGENYILRVTDHEGKAYFPLSFGLDDLGKNRIKISSPHMLAGENEKEVLVGFPWTPCVVLLLLIVCIVTSVYAIRYKRKLKAWENWASYALRR